MEVDLIADILQGSDAARIHALHRFLNDNHDNIFNENWQAIIDKRGERACGTVAKDGGQALWGVEADAPAGRPTIFPFPVPKPNPGQPLRATVTDRKAVKFKEAPVLRGALAIAGWLQKKRKPVVIGVLYGPSTARPMLFTNRYGQIERPGLSGHTVLVVVAIKLKKIFFISIPGMADRARLIKAEFGAIHSQNLARWGSSASTGATWFGVQYCGRRP
ncbi:MAG: hypothetical protein IPK63_19615 [Candidatus Competibacteraceae bacterium]|nr:hypothetical protein [Candidatus Competibacteraceae bacterium]